MRLQARPYLVARGHRMVLCVFVVAFLVPAGISGQEADHDCTWYPQQEELRQKWEPTGDEAWAEAPPVALMIQSWEARQTHQRADEPALYVEWDDWPSGERPDILQDLVCNMALKIEQGAIPARAAAVGPTSEGVALQAMAMLGDEQKQQAGSKEPFCCHVRLFGEYFSIGYARTDILSTEFQSGVVKRTTFGGTVERSVAVEGQVIHQEGAAPFEIQVDSPVNVLHVEARWESPGFSMDLLLRGPGSGDSWEYRTSGDSPGEPSGTANLTLDRSTVEEFTGEWEVTVAAAGAAVDVDFEIRVTLAKRDLPSDYRAF